MFTQWPVRVVLTLFIALNLRLSVSVGLGAPGSTLGSGRTGEPGVSSALVSSSASSHAPAPGCFAGNAAEMLCLQNERKHCYYSKIVKSNT